MPVGKHNRVKMNDREYAIRPNKSQQKREIKVLNLLGRELVKLPAGSLSKFPLSSELSDAILEAKKLSKGALQRQLRRIASLMLQEDAEAIQLELDRQKMPSREQTQELHLLESWRESLIEGDEKLLSDIISEHPSVDRQHFRQLVRNAQTERQQNKPPKAYRALYKYLTQIRTDARADQANDPVSAN